MVMGKNLPAALQTAVTRLPLRLVNRRVATAADQVPDGTVKISQPDGTSEQITSAEVLQKVLLPSAPIQ
jgi:hypothetical protein